jgi:aerobic-type carbon monoxide dehydrogenase small subunit (CoxS/CutS family)
MTEHSVTFTLNGERREARVDPRIHLGDFLRHSLGLTGTHLGCEHGVCGACTVQVDGEAVRSCLMLAVQARGRSVRTVEDLAGKDELHPLQQAFYEQHALQCGFCTAGILMSMEAFLRDHEDPTEGEIREALAGNLCRCTGYVAMVEAIARASRTSPRRTPPDRPPS